VPRLQLQQGRSNDKNERRCTHICILCIDSSGECAWLQDQGIVDKGICVDGAMMNFEASFVGNAVAIPEARVAWMVAGHSMDAQKGLEK